VTRAALSIALCLTALGLGFFTACRAARNRARAAELDARERWCETYSRQNELLLYEVRGRQWALLSGHESAAASSVTGEATQ